MAQNKSRLTGHNASDIRKIRVQTLGSGVAGVSSAAAGTGLTGGGTGAITLNIGAGDGMTINADDIALTLPGTLTAATANAAAGNHTHAITTTADAETTPSTILAGDASGDLKLRRLGAGIAPTAAVHLRSAATPQMIIDNNAGHTLTYSMSAAGTITITGTKHLYHVNAAGSMRYDMLTGVGFGIWPLKPLHVESTTVEQFRLGYDSSDYAGFEVQSDGHLLIDTEGTDADMTLAPASDLFLSPTGATTTVTGALNATGKITGAGIIHPAFNTLGYGVVGDDATDDTTSLASTFTAAVSENYSTVYIHGIARYNSASNLALADGMKITGGAGDSGIRFTGTVEGLTAAVAMRVTLDEVSMYG